MTTPRRRAAPLPRGGSRGPDLAVEGDRLLELLVGLDPVAGGDQLLGGAQPGVGLSGSVEPIQGAKAALLEVAAGHCRRGLQPGGWGVDRARQLDQLTSSAEREEDDAQLFNQSGAAASAPCSARIASTSSALAAASPARPPASRTCPWKASVDRSS